MLDIKNDFPIFSAHPNLIYLDSTATSLKPQSVINKTIEYYSKYSSNIHRGIYAIAEEASREFEETREITAKFINAFSTKEIIFTRGTTESLNLVMYTWGEQYIQEDDEIVVTLLEHHANFVPWQQLAKKKKAIFKVIDIETNNYELQIGNLETIITKKTKLLALTYVSNVTGTINPIKEIIKKARSINPDIIVVIDGAQAVPHMKVNVQLLDCDFFAFSSHKMLGPTGVGVLWGKEKLLNQLKPFQYGGDMIRSVSVENTEFNDTPSRFEAGTPDIAGIIAFKEAIQYLEQIGFSEVEKHEHELTEYALDCLLEAFPNISILGSKKSDNRAAIISFSLNPYHAHDISQILDENGICVRAGHHCAMPLHEFMNFSASVRASFYIYNTKNDVDNLIEGLLKVKKVLTI